jgi:hypothetical protein
MAEALVHYKDSARVMQVAGTTLAPPVQQGRDAFLLPVTSTWGWGTWQRAWTNFSWVPKGWPQTVAETDWLSAFQLDGAADYVSMLENRLAGRNDSWGILWWYAVSRNRGKVVYPTQSLVRNIGFDGSGVHCGKEAVFDFRKPSSNERSEWPDQFPVFPDDEVVDPAHYQLLKTMLSGLSGLDLDQTGRRPFWQRLFVAIKGRIKRDPA